MNEYQLIAAICRKNGLPFTLEHLEALATLCREYRAAQPAPTAVR